MAARFPGHHNRHASAGRHMVDREYLYVHLPDLPLRLICNEKGWQIDKAIALYWRHQNMDRLVYLSDTAKKAGLYTGMAVADARARLPDILLAEIAPQQDRAILEKLA
jgi:protein ImuB